MGPSFLEIDMKDSKPYQMIFQINWMLWGVLLCSQIFFIVMAIPIMHFDQIVQTLPAEKSPIAFPLFLSLSLVLGGLSYYCHLRAYKVAPSQDPQKLVESFKKFQINNMFSWALAELITLLGIVSVLFQAPSWVLFSLCLSGFSLHAYYFPRLRKFFENFQTS